jgi:hypothetical protein
MQSQRILPINRRIVRGPSISASIRSIEAPFTFNRTCHLCKLKAQLTSRRALRGQLIEYPAVVRGIVDNGD